MLTKFVRENSCVLIKKSQLVNVKNRCLLHYRYSINNWLNYEKSFSPYIKLRLIFFLITFAAVKMEFGRRAIEFSARPLIRQSAGSSRYFAHYSSRNEILKHARGALMAWNTYKPRLSMCGGRFSVPPAVCCTYVSFRPRPSPSTFNRISFSFRADFSSLFFTSISRFRDISSLT